MKDDCCNQNPHDSRCPYAPEQDGMMTCSSCGEGIYEGDYYYDIDEDLCEDCFTSIYRKIAGK